MSVKINPRDRVVVTNFRYNPGGQISLFSLKEVGTSIGDVSNGAVLMWDGSQFVAANTISTNIFGGTYDQTGSLGGSTLQLRYSEVAEKPLDGSLKQGELAYSFLPDNWDGLKWDGGQTLYVGDANGNAIAIGSKRIYDYANHADGITVANSFLIVGDDKNVDTLKIGEMRFDGSTLSVENAGSNLYLSPGGLAQISATGHRVINLQDPVDSQDAVTKNYVDAALANYSVAPVTIADNPPLLPDRGDLWYDAANTYRLYVWDDVTAAWVDASPTVESDRTALVIIANTAPSNAEIGQAWYDADDTGRTYIWDGVQWVDMAPDQAQDDQTHVHVSDNPPVNPNSGDLWYDSANSYRLFVWDDVTSSWIDASPNTGDDTHVTVDEVPPQDPKSGDLWYDAANTYRLYVWDNTTDAWVDVAPSVNSAQPLIVIQDLPPQNPEVGLAWYDSSNTGGGRTFTWDGLQWVDISPQGTGGSSSNALILIANDPPASPERGQAWYDSDPLSQTSGRTFVWDSAQWVDIAPSQGLDEPHSIISSIAPPSPQYGDIWIDSSQNNTPFAWDGAQWLNIAPQAAQKPPVTISSVPPAGEVGYLWYDSDDTGRTFVWDGVQWVDIAPQNELPDVVDSRIALTQPLNPYDGQVWFNTASEIGYVWVNGGWQEMSNPNSGTPHVLIDSVAPSSSTTEQGDLWYNTTNNTPMMFDGAQWIPFVEHPETPAVGLITIANTAPSNAEIGQAWYDEDDTGRTFLWDGIQWVDLAPNHSSIETWSEIYSVTDLTGSGSITVPVSSFYKKIAVVFENTSTLNNTVQLSGVNVTGLTTNGNSYKLTDFSINIFNYPFNTRLDIETYQTGDSKPPTFLMNKYNEELASITIAPKITGDTFTSGSLSVWAIT